MEFTLNVSVNVTRKEAEYLAFAYRKQVEEGDRVTTTTMAKTFDITAAAVTESFQKLAEKNLVEYTPYYGIRLTEKGTAEARRFLRKHRLLETLFVRFMKYAPMEACDEASKIDYYCSEALANNICSTYNHPAQCPCNKQIYTGPDCKDEKKTPRVD